MAKTTFCYKIQKSKLYSLLDTKPPHPTKRRVPGKKKTFFWTLEILNLIKTLPTKRNLFFPDCSEMVQSKKIARINEKNIKSNWGPSLLVQCLRIHLPMQATWVQSLAQEDPTCHGATKPMHHRYWSPHI